MWQHALPCLPATLMLRCPLCGQAHRITFTSSSCCCCCFVIIAVIAHRLSPLLYRPTNARYVDVRETMMLIIVAPIRPHPQMQTTSLRGNVLIPPPPTDFHCCLLPLLIVKCPPRRSILVSVRSDAVGKNVGGGTVLEIITLSRSRLLASPLLRSLLRRKEFRGHGTK